MCFYHISLPSLIMFFILNIHTYMFISQNGVILSAFLYRCLFRLQMTRTMWGRISSATIHLRLAARLTSTCEKWPSASHCLLGDTCWCQPPSSLTRRPTSSFASSLRRRPKLCECSVLGSGLSLDVEQ